VRLNATQQGRAKALSSACTWGRAGAVSPPRTGGRGAKERGAAAAFFLFSPPNGVRLRMAWRSGPRELAASSGASRPAETRGSGAFSASSPEALPGALSAGPPRVPRGPACRDERGGRKREGARGEEPWCAPRAGPLTEKGR